MKKQWYKVECWTNNPQKVTDNICKDSDYFISDIIVTKLDSYVSLDNPFPEILADKK